MNQKVLFCSLECRFYTEKYRLFTKKSPVCTKNCPFSIKCRFSNVKCPFIKCPGQSKIHRAPHAKKNMLTFYFKNISFHEYNCTSIFYKKQDNLRSKAFYFSLRRKISSKKGFIFFVKKHFSS